MFTYKEIVHPGGFEPPTSASVAQRSIQLSHGCNLAGEQGFEPQLPGPEPGVLPLDDSPILVEKQADEFTRSIGPSQKEIPPN